MEIAAQDASISLFERYKEELLSATLPPALRTQFELHVGRGYQYLGNRAAAREWLERALVNASEYSFNQLIFAAEDALAVNDAPLDQRIPTPESIIPSDLEEIAIDLRSLRELAVAAIE